MKYKPIVTPKPLTSAIKSLRSGDVETLAKLIEEGSGAIFLKSFTPEERARLARTIRTGSPLTRSEKRDNNEECSERDKFLTVRVFYWLGFGFPGFSNTAEDTAFHAAVRDYESEIIRGAPARTAESLYRHVWKPYLKRVESGECTDDDTRIVRYNSFFWFIRGVKASDSEAEERQKRREWFKKYFMKPSPESSLYYFDSVSCLDLLAPVKVHRWVLERNLHDFLWNVRAKDKSLKKLFSD